MSSSCDKQLLKDLRYLSKRHVFEDERQIGAFSPQKIQVELLWKDPLSGCWAMAKNE
jgi:hypothetical protein